MSRNIFDFDELMLIKEVVEVTRLSRRTLYQMAKDGILVPFKVSKRAVRYNRVDVQRYLRGQQNKRTA